MLLNRLNKTYYFNANDKSSYYYFSRRLMLLLKNSEISERPVVILCIGSDRSTGDSLGPIIGYKLSKQFIENLYIYGTLDHPVHALNLEETIANIYENHPNPFVIAVDASLGKTDHIGYVTLSKNSLKPGIGVNKKLPEIGDLSITGIVNFSGILDTMLLQSTRLSVVMNIADCIAHGIAINFDS